MEEGKPLTYINSLDENDEQSSILVEDLKFGQVIYYGVDVRNKATMAKG